MPKRPAPTKEERRERKLHHLRVTLRRTLKKVRELDVRRRLRRVKMRGERATTEQRRELAVARGLALDELVAEAERRHAQRRGGDEAPEGPSELAQASAEHAAVLGRLMDHKEVVAVFDEIDVIERSDFDELKKQRKRERIEAAANAAKRKAPESVFMTSLRAADDGPDFEAMEDDGDDSDDAIVVRNLGSDDDDDDDDDDAEVLGGVFGDDDDDDDDGEDEDGVYVQAVRSGRTKFDVGDAGPRVKRNRLSQRRRRLLAERLHGKKAKHIEAGEESIREFFRRRQEDRDRKRKLLGRRKGGRVGTGPAGMAAAAGAAAAPDKDEKVHPSWEAKRKQRELMDKPLPDIRAKKITFDD